MGAATSRRISTVVAWGSFVVLAWAAFTLFSSGGAAHADDDDRPPHGTTIVEHVEHVAQGAVKHDTSNKGASQKDHASQKDNGAQKNNGSQHKADKTPRVSKAAPPAVKAPAAVKPATVQASPAKVQTPAVEKQHVEQPPVEKLRDVASTGPRDHHDDAHATTSRDHGHGHSSWRHDRDSHADRFGHAPHPASSDVRTTRSTERPAAASPAPAATTPAPTADAAPPAAAAEIVTTQPANDETAGPDRYPGPEPANEFPLPGSASNTPAAPPSSSTAGGHPASAVGDTPRPVAGLIDSLRAGERIRDAAGDTMPSAPVADTDSSPD